MNKLETLKKKIRYRASYRGTKEMDIILTSFIESLINSLNLNELESLCTFLDNEDEDIKTHIMSYDEAMLRLEQGEIDNAATVISLQWLALNRQRIVSDLQND